MSADRNISESDEQPPLPTDVTVLPVRGESPYDVLVGHDPDPVALIGTGVSRVALVHDSALTDQAGRLAGRIRAGLPATQVLSLPVPSGEQSKTPAVAAECWEALGAAGFTRSDMVVTMGGGSTTDLGGFVAATWLRGVRVLHVPTSLLAMVDAAVGGKTGVNTAAGKNLVGAFHEPAGVVCDLDLLRTLPHEELVAGMGEVIKCGFIADPRILDLVEADPRAALDVEGPVLRELVERAIAVKIEVVGRDLRETGDADGPEVHPGREILNYGHTLAHAIERASGYSVRHGEAVAIGCCYVASVARRVGLIDADLEQRHRSAFGSVGLPTAWQGAPFADLLPTMRVDKKARGNTLRLLVLHGLAEPRILTGPDEAILEAAYADLR